MGLLVLQPGFVIRRLVCRSEGPAAPVQKAVAGFQALHAANVEMPAQRLLQPLLAVVGVLVFLVAQQGLHLVVLARNVFDDQLVGQLGQPVDEFIQRHVGRNDDVMNQRQAQHQIRLGALPEFQALSIAPAPAGRRISHVLNERQDVFRRPAAHFAVQPFDCEMIEIHRQHLSRGVGRCEP